MMRWRTTLPVPPQFVQCSVFPPSHVGQTRLPVPQVQSTSPLTQSGQGTVRPFVAGSGSAAAGVGTPQRRRPSETLEGPLRSEGAAGLDPFSPTEVPAPCERT